MSDIRKAIVKGPNNQSLIRPRSVFELLKSEGIIRIPQYQRPYSWEANNVEDLLHDIKSSYEDKKEWFLGTLFTSQHEDEDSNNPEYLDILDGQQRITTIIMILRAAYVCCFQVNLTFSDTDKEEEIREGFEVIKEDIKECLLKRDRINRTSRNFISKFETDNSVKEAVSNWCTSILEITDKETFEANREIESTSRSSFSPTRVTFNKNLNVIYSFFKELLLDKETGSEIVDGLEKVINIIDHLLNNFYVIQIPLKDRNDVLDIFESLNNRGKPLNLSDILRFKSISQTLNKVGDATLIEEAWFEIFKSSQDLTFLFKDLNVFIERYINSIGSENNGYTSDESRIKTFCNIYSDYSEGVDSMKNTLKTINYILDESGRTNTYIHSVKKIDSNEAIKSYGLIKLLKAALISSENAQITFIGVIEYLSANDQFISRHKNENQCETQTLFFNSFIFEFIKYVISADIMQKIESNERRPLYIKLSQSLRESFNPNFYKILPNHSKLNSPRKEHIKNLIFIKHNGKTAKKQCELLLYFTQFIDKYNDIPRTILEEKNLEHLIPDKWYNEPNWKSALSENQLEIEINKISDVNVKLALVEMFEDHLWNDTDSTISFIQLIGNKVYIESQANCRAGNKFWEDVGRKEGKLSIYKKHFSRNVSYCVPAFDDITTYAKFEIEHVIKRSVYILDVIRTNQDIEYRTITSL